MQPLNENKSFLGRKTWGIANYLLIAIMFAFALGAIPRGVRKAIESNSNNAKDWLPPTYAESIDLQWFQRHFAGEQFVIITCDGATYGNPEKLRHLSRRLLAVGQGTHDNATDATAATTTAAEGEVHWFSRVLLGPDAVAELMEESNLSESEALRRLEGALVGSRGKDDEGNLLPQESRSTCLIATLAKVSTENNMNMRKAIDFISHEALDCAIKKEDLHMGGPPVDNITIDIEGERTLYRLAVLSGLVGFGLSFWCFRSMKLTAMVFTVGVISAGASLALVYYFGVFEIYGLGKPRAKLGTTDAILMSMPAVVYVLGLSGAVHIVNYYKDARRETGLAGAAEKAFSHAWGPCTLAALTTAVGLGTLYTSDIFPIKKFGLFTGIGVIATLGVLFSMLPVLLHRFPISEEELEEDERRNSANRRFSIEGLLMRMGGFVIKHNTVVALFWLVVMGIFALGIPKIVTSVQLLKLFDKNADIIHDYAWIEKHLGNLVPMEVVLAIDGEHQRTETSKEIAEANGESYKMTMLERVEFVQRVAKRIESLPQIGKALSVATFVPAASRRAYTGGEHALNIALNEARERLFEDDYLRLEVDEKGSPTGRELWRISARVRALDDGRGNEMDYGVFVKEIREVVDPVILAYRQRDAILKQLSKRDKRLSTSRLIILYRSKIEESNENKPLPNSQERLLVEILRESGPEKIIVNGKGAKRIDLLNLAKLPSDPEKLAKTSKALEKRYAAAIIVSAGSQDTVAKQIAKGIPLIDVSRIPAHDKKSPVGWTVTKGKPLPIAAVYTGVVPVVYKTQRELLTSLQRSIGWATLLIAVVMMVVFRSPVAGLLSMIPNIFPVLLVFGALGWLQFKVSIGIMMTASVALGVAVDDTVHFVWWFKHGIADGLNRKDATMLAYKRCGVAMIQTTLIAGLGLAVFISSTFTPTQQFGFMMITILSAALLGDLMLLPAILSGPMGAFFSGKTPTEDATKNSSVDSDQQGEEDCDSDDSEEATIPLDASLRRNKSARSARAS